MFVSSVLLHLGKRKRCVRQETRQYEKKRFGRDLVKFSKGKSILSEVDLENHETQFEMHKIFNPN